MFFIIHDICGGSRHKLGLQRAQNKMRGKHWLFFFTMERKVSYQKWSRPIIRYLSFARCAITDQVHVERISSAHVCEFLSEVDVKLMTWKVLAQPGVTGAAETVHIGQSGLSCQDGGGPLPLLLPPPPLGPHRVDRSVAFPWPGEELYEDIFVLSLTKVNHRTLGHL